MDLLKLIGESHEETLLVSENDTANRYGSGLLEVFATPAMIALMEKTALQTVLPELEEGYDTVGIEISVKHIKATAIGKHVRCSAELISVDRNKLNFSVTAWDEDDKIGFGTHTRYIIQTKEFLTNLHKH